MDTLSKATTRSLAVQSRVRCALFAFLSGLAGCSTVSSLSTSVQQMAGFGEPDANLTAAIADSQAMNSAEYLIGPEDVLEISVWKEDNLKKETLVRPDGGISFPLAGEVHAAGKSTEQIRQELTDRLEKYIPDPVVSVLVEKAANYRVYVVGRVNKPGDL